MPKKSGSSTGSEITLPLRPFKVLLIGDSCIDKYVYGTCERMSPEAPVPVLKWENIKQHKGMCWNVRNNLMSFGVEVYTMTNEEQPIKTRYVDIKSNQQIMRVDENDTVRSWQDHHEYQLPDGDYHALVISDYDKGFLTEEFLLEIIDWFDGPIFVDTKKPICLPDKVFTKINEHEQSVIGKKTDNMIITMGSRGAEYQGRHFIGQKVNTFDVCGAGDTFLAALVYFYLMYGTIVDAIPFANMSASVAVQHQGTYVLTENDIKAIHGFSKRSN